MSSGARLARTCHVGSRLDDLRWLTVTRAPGVEQGTKRPARRRGVIHASSGARAAGVSAKRCAETIGGILVRMARLVVVMNLQPQVSGGLGSGHERRAGHPGGALHGLHPDRGL